MVKEGKPVTTMTPATLVTSARAVTPSTTVTPNNKNDASNSRGGGPLLTIETEVNGDSKSTNERGPYVVGFWACRASTRDFYSALSVLVIRELNIFFITVHYFKFLCPHRPASWAGSHAGSPVS